MANNSHVTNPTRRALVAGLAAAPVAGMASPAPAQAAEADPIFAALAEYHRAHDARKVKADAFNEAERRWFAVRDNFPNHVLLYGKFPIYKPEDVAKYMPEDMAGYSPEEVSACTTIETTARNRLARALARRQAERDRLGLKEAEEAAEAASNVLIEAEAAVLATVPATKAGALALVAFIRGQVEKGCETTEDTLAAITSLESFLAGVAHV